jgi:hypothetical protein
LKEPLTQLRLGKQAQVRPLPQGERIALPLNPRKIRHAVHRITEPCQQSQPERPFFRVWIIHHHAIKKGIDRRAQRGQRRHRVFEIFGLDSCCGLGLGAVEGVEEGGLFLP